MRDAVDDNGITNLVAFRKVLTACAAFYANNGLKRLVKTPKLYFCDTGLAAYLSMWTTKDVLMNGAASGHYFENYVVGELLRGYTYGSSKIKLSFYRDANQREVDVIVEENGITHPLEIKRASNPDKKIINTLILAHSIIIACYSRPKRKRLLLKCRLKLHSTQFGCF